MSSRMERYYKSDTVKKKRSQKNQELYRTIYEDGQYSNIEGIASIEKNNEIDISKVKEMLKNREDYRRQKNYRTSIKPKEVKEQPKEDEFLLDNNEKTYDIRDVLNKVKDEKPEEDDRYLSLNDDNYDFLKELKEKKENPNKQDEELKDMIDTITNTSMLNKMEDKDLSFDLLDDLDSVEDDDTDIVEEPTETQIDKSFFTASMKIKKEDFADIYEQTKDKRRKIKRDIIIIVVLVVLIAIVGFVIFKILKS